MDSPLRSVLPRVLVLRALGWIRLVAWFDLALGLLILGYAAFNGLPLNLVRGGLVLAGIGVFGLFFFSSRRRLESLRAPLWHLLGFLLIGYGTFQVIGDLVADVGHWGIGLVLVAFGTWAWVRGIRARRELSERAKLA